MLMQSLLSLLLSREQNYPLVIIIIVITLFFFSVLLTARLRQCCVSSVQVLTAVLLVFYCHAVPSSDLLLSRVQNHPLPVLVGAGRL